LTITSRCWYP